jgi:hypothetical protein
MSRQALTPHLKPMITPKLIQIELRNEEKAQVRNDHEYEMSRKRRSGAITMGREAHHGCDNGAEGRSVEA